jgi:hypothetical protein
MFTRKKKFGNFKKRKKKYRKSVINKGLNVRNNEYPNTSQMPDTTNALVSTQYFQDHQSCDMQDGIGFESNVGRSKPGSKTQHYFVSAYTCFLK